MKPNSEDYLKILHKKAIELDVVLEPYQLDLLASYTELLLKWNKVYSLTSITNLSDIVNYHLLDGLSIIKFLNNLNSIADIGSGMGIPGIIIAICCPHMRVYLIDCNSKKSAFLRQVAIELKLANVFVIESLVEKVSLITKVDAVISRAFAKAWLFISLTSHLLSQNGKFFLMKSQNVQEELTEVPNSYSYRVIPLQIPEVEVMRCLVEIKFNTEIVNV